MTILMTRQDLVNIKSRALRTRAWFRALSKVERAIIDLTIKCVKEIRSLTLENVLSSIIDKMLDALENGFISKVEEVGRLLAENLGNVAQKWGHKNASCWKYDKAFIIYLGVSSIN